MRAVFQWSLGTRALELGKRTLIMGIVNVTPDSFSDGGLYLDSSKAADHALQLLDEGADIIDIGGESTRPGAKVVPASSQPEGQEQEEKPETSGGFPTTRVAVRAEEELRRVLPVIMALKKQRPNAVISIDTYKASVARAGAAAGAEIINDVSGLRWDAQMGRTIAELKCGAVLMHMRGRPEEWRTLPPPGDLVLLVKRELREWAEAAVLAADLAAKPTRAIALTKRLLDDGWQRLLADQLAEEAVAQSQAAAGADFAEGVAAFLEKRPPRFQGR